MATRMREKTAKRHENADRRPRAVARYVRVAPRKVRAVVNLIRGKSVKEAEAILMLTPRGATEPVMKVLKSAEANAQNNLDMNPDDLFVAEAYADQGPTLMRYRPRAHGRASRIRKRTSHITIVLDQQAK